MQQGAERSSAWLAATERSAAAVGLQQRNGVQCSSGWLAATERNIEIYREGVREKYSCKESGVCFSFRRSGFPLCSQRRSASIFDAVSGVPL